MGTYYSVNIEKMLTVNDIISYLEDDNDVLEADVYITPPENFDKSDEDSGNEESTDINCLSRHQLLAAAELRAKVSVEGRIEEIHQQESQEEQPTSSTSQNPPAEKQSKRTVSRKWRNVDIPQKAEKEWTPPSFLQDFHNPQDFFELFYDEDVIELLRSQTEQNARQKGHVNFKVSSDEIKRFIGILLLSGYNGVARYRMYWEQSIDCHHPGVAACMSRNRFEELLRFYHACDNTNLQPGDKFCKVRPLWDLLNRRWLKYFPGDRNLSIDESMVPYFGKHPTKQHIHGKPIRFGYKVWAICTRLGYLIYGEPYQGASTGNTHPSFGVGGSVVLDLISKLPAGNYSFYMDNFFTSIPLLAEIKSLGHDATGTIRGNRVENAPLKDSKDMKKMKRGSYNQTTDVSSDITLVRYNDNNIVTIASTECGVGPVGKVKRWCDKQKKEVDQPRCFISYNKYMGGVDRLDQNVGCYRIGIRLKRWYWQLLMFPLNVSINNAYQLYRMSPSAKEKDSHDLLSFTRYVVQSYFMTKSVTNSSASSNGTITKAKYVPKSSLAVIKRVPSSIRLDRKDHYMVDNGKQSRCGLCHKNTTKKCGKCAVALHAKCSEVFHTIP
ncbi:unnamed protein product [Parnassius mnemosyne]|uniref:PiggyBac transposable element-derived protein domain-containing protein n=1 Tax=Parnassius mnemosyne TaxID=213953 RepID=A0AAV1M188_9NEOP